MRRSAYIFVSLLALIAQPSFGQSNTPAPCEAYVEMLRYEPFEITTEKWRACSLLEQFIINTHNWTDFILTLRANIEQEGYPAYMYVAFSAAEHGDYHKAFAISDLALADISGQLSIRGEWDRRELYLGLVLAWRNELFSEFGMPEDTSARILDEYSNLPFTDLENTEVGSQQKIICLISFDAFTVSLDDLLSSVAFQKCLET